MAINNEWLDEKTNEIKKMQEEIDKRIEQLTQQKIMNYGAIAMINEMKKELDKEEKNEQTY